MKIYDLTETRFDGRGDLQISSTDLAMIEWLLTELQHHNPPVRARDEILMLDTKKICSITLKKLPGNYGSLLTYWLVNSLLCHQGWEPFAKDLNSSSFRKVKETES